jgi:hypothetical protein
MSACHLRKMSCLTEDRARAHVFSLLYEAIMDKEGQGVLDCEVQLLPKALLQVRLTSVVQLALSQWDSCSNCLL